MAKQKLRVGVVGIGFMGSNHFNIWRQHKSAEVVAIADVNRKKLSGDWSEIVGNIDVGGGKVNLKGIKTYANPALLINDPDVDVVDICLPTYLHARVAIKALEAGKHVLCEKPMAHTVADAAKLAAAAKKAAAKGQKFMVAHCIRFWPEYSVLKDIVSSGKYGKVLSMHMKRLSPTPVWSWSNWLMSSNKSGAAALDLHIHDTDFANYLFGKPKAVVSRGVKGVASRGYDHIVTQYVYTGVPQVSAEGGWIIAPTASFEMAFHVMMEKATIYFSTASSPALKVCTGKKVLTPKVPSGDGYTREIDYFAQCVLKDKQPEVVTPEDALLSVKTVFAEIESARKGGKPVQVR